MSDEQGTCLVQKAPRQADATIEVLRATDDARDTEGVAAHGLGLGELGVWEGREAPEAGEHRWREAVLFHVHQVADRHAHAHGERAGDRVLLSLPGGWHRPGLLIGLGIVLAQAEHTSRPRCHGDDTIHFAGRHAPEVGEEHPLVWIMLQGLGVDEEAVAPTGRLALQRQGDQVAEPTFGQGVLVREQPVVRV